MGPTWGPPGSCWPQMGPMLAPLTLLSGKFIGLRWALCWPHKPCYQGSSCTTWQIKFSGCSTVRYISLKRVPARPYMRRMTASPMGSRHLISMSKYTIAWGILFPSAKMRDKTLTFRGFPSMKHPQCISMFQIIISFTMWITLITSVIFILVCLVAHTGDICCRERQHIQVFIGISKCGTADQSGVIKTTNYSY